MSQQVIILHGLPASGKSTWAKQFIKENTNFKRISRDDFRHMLDGYSLDRDLENSITKMVHSSLETLLRGGFSVIIDATNLRPSYIKDYMKIIRKVPKEVFVRIQSFENVPYAELLERDDLRENRVGKEVINRMMKSLRSNSSKKLEQVLYELDTISGSIYTPPVDKPKAILCDIDGTLAHMNGRGPFEWNRVDEDDVDWHIRYLVNKVHEDYRVILLSGRDSVCRELTMKWLFDFEILYDDLFMRQENDMRKDSVVKLELFDVYIRNNYDVQFVLDDRQQVVDMWRSIGLRCYQVAEGNF